MDTSQTVTESKVGVTETQQSADPDEPKFGGFYQTKSSIEQDPDSSANDIRPNFGATATTDDSIP